MCAHACVYFSCSHFFFVDGQTDRNGKADRQTKQNNKIACTYKHVHAFYRTQLGWESVKSEWDRVRDREKERRRLLKQQKTNFGLNVAAANSHSRTAQHKLHCVQVLGVNRPTKIVRRLKSEHYKNSKTSQKENFKKRSSFVQNQTRKSQIFSFLFWIFLLFFFETISWVKETERLCVCLCVCLGVLRKKGCHTHWKKKGPERFFLFVSLKINQHYEDLSVCVCTQVEDRGQRLSSKEKTKLSSCLSNYLKITDEKKSYKSETKRSIFCFPNSLIYRSTFSPLILLFFCSLYLIIMKPKKEKSSVSNQQIFKLNSFSSSHRKICFFFLFSTRKKKRLQHILRSHFDYIDVISFITILNPYKAICINVGSNIFNFVSETKKNLTEKRRYRFSDRKRHPQSAHQTKKNVHLKLISKQWSFKNVFSVPNQQAHVTFNTTGLFY